MADNNRLDLGIMLVVLLPLFGVPDPKPVIEHLSDSFEWHPLAFWIEENDEEPANEADSSIESKGTTRRPAFHHR